MWTLYVMEISAFSGREAYEKAFGYVDKARTVRLVNMRQEHQRVQSLAAGLLLSFVLEKYISGETMEGIIKPDGKQVLAALASKRRLHIHSCSIEKGMHGKPYIAELPDFHFNLSHSGNYVVCGVSDTEIGVDIQRVREPVKETLTRRVRQDKEQGDFFDIWAAKEAYCKCTGEGLLKDFRSLRCNFEDMQVEDTESGKKRQLYLWKGLAGYSAAVCLDDNGHS